MKDRERTPTGWKTFFAVLVAFTLFAVSARGQTLSVSVRFTVSADCGSGAKAALYLTKTGPVGITNWALEFAFGRTLSPYSDASVLSHVGNHYVLTNMSYAATIPANGGTMVFQSSVTPGGLNGDQPTNYILN